MFNDSTLASIRSGTNKEVYEQINSVALFMATGGFLDEANQLLTSLWSHKLLHDRDLWLQDISFMMFWHARGEYPDQIPFPLRDIDTLEKEMRAYIAVDRWSYNPRPEQPWTALHSHDLLRVAYISAGLVSDSFPSPEKELNAVAMIEKLAKENYISNEGFSLGAELAARNGQTDTAIFLAKTWAGYYFDEYPRFHFSLLSTGRHIAPLLLQHIIADELQLTEDIVRNFLSRVITELDHRLEKGRDLCSGNLSWQRLLEVLSEATIEHNINNETQHTNLLMKGAESAAITQTEKRLGITLPDDYKEFLLHSNGTHPLFLNPVELLPVDQIGFLPDMTDTFFFESLTDFSYQDIDEASLKIRLSKAILLTRYPDEQMVWLMPVDDGINTWETWFFANWYPGEERHHSFRLYLEQELQTLTHRNINT